MLREPDRQVTNLMNRLWRSGASVMIAVLGLALLGSVWVVQARLDDRPGVIEGRSSAALGVNYPNCRFGVGGNTSAFSVTALNIGWSMDWGTQLNPPHPNGAEYIQVVTIKPATGGYVFNPPTSTLYAILDQNPGATWLIGNEPDSPWQDNLWPETYAQAYHQLYYLIKQRDSSARVGAGNIVQPTPLRMQYLDRVLKAYQQNYAESLPADLWSIHSYILREIDPADPEAVPHGPLEVWGANIPPGITATRGMLYTYSQQYDLTIFRQRLLDFRTWMRDRGYRDTPLYISEYGTLFPYVPYITPPDYQDEYGVDMNEARATAFMTGTFNVLRQSTDANVGYAADGNHLVQRWLWYSLSDKDLGGLLFDPTSHARRPIGDVFAAYTSAISPQVDLVAVRLTADPLTGLNVSQPQTVTLHAWVSNAGNISATPPLTVEFYSGYSPTGTLIDTRAITSPLSGCGTVVNTNFTWPGLTQGLHPAYVRVVGQAALSETNSANNVVSAQILIAPPRAYLPLLLKAIP
jgi:hypothetical protein